MFITLQKHHNYCSWNIVCYIFRYPTLVFILLVTVLWSLPCVTGTHTWTVCISPIHMACSEGWQVLEGAQRLFWRAAITLMDHGLSTTSYTSQAMSIPLHHLLVGSKYISWLVLSVSLLSVVVSINVGHLYWSLLHSSWFFQKDFGSKCTLFILPFINKTFFFSKQVKINVPIFLLYKEYVWVLMQLVDAATFLADYTKDSVYMQGFQVRKRNLSVDLFFGLW